ncbi:MAG: polysaccharide export protein [Alphaproteobacteria bacterium]|nr:polysaccharide export protein [Alphaproteobacteria bacterium]
MKKVLILLALLLAMPSVSRAASVEAAPFKIIAGDVLQITVWKEEGLDREVLVLPDGDITFPLIGSVKAQGSTLDELQSLVKHKLKKFIPNATVTVTVKAAMGHTVNVIGQVNKPGEILLGRQLTTMQALSQAGGLTPYADDDAIIIMRHRGESDDAIPVPYSDIVSGNNLDRDFVLQPGDVIIVPTAGLF